MVVGIRAEGIGRFAIHHGADGRGDPRRGERTVCGSPRVPRLAPRARAALLKPGRRWNLTDRSSGAGAPRGMRGTTVFVYLCGRGHRRVLILKRVSDGFCARRLWTRLAMIRMPRGAPAPSSGQLVPPTSLINSAARALGASRGTRGGSSTVLSPWWGSPRPPAPWRVAAALSSPRREL